MNNCVFKEILAKEDSFPKEVNLDGLIDYSKAGLKRKYQDEVIDCDGDKVSLNHLFGQILKAFIDKDNGFEAKLGMVTAIDAILKVTTEKASSMLNPTVLQQLKTIVKNVYCGGQFKNYGYLSKISQIMSVTKKSDFNSDILLMTSNIPGHGDLNMIMRRLSHSDESFNLKHFMLTTVNLVYRVTRLVG